MQRIVLTAGFLLVPLLIPTDALTPCAAEDDVQPSRAVDYEREIKPLLFQKCAACHGALKQNSGLRMDAGELIRKGGHVAFFGRTGAGEAVPVDILQTILRENSLKKHICFHDTGLATAFGIPCSSAFNFRISCHAATARKSNAATLRYNGRRSQSNPAVQG